VARRRLDAELVRRGLVATRSQAQSAVRGGLVLVSGRSASKSSTLVDAAEPLELVGEPQRFVSRAGEKLEAALERFAIDVHGRDGLDAGASTGGFTDCLLRRGAEHVVAVDVGYGQLAWSLRNDQRVTSSIGQRARPASRTCRTLRDRGRRPILHLAPPRHPAARPGLVGTPIWSCWSSRSSRSAANGWFGRRHPRPDTWRDAILGVTDASSSTASRRST
jgi:hypothetical protein